jgi:hypothetical protein
MYYKYLPFCVNRIGPCSSTAVNGIIYVFLHGRGVFKFEMGNYEFIASLPIEDWFCFDVCNLENGNIVFLNGGVSKSKVLKAMFAFDVVHRTWKQMPDMLRQRRRCASAILRY